MVFKPFTHLARPILAKSFTHGYAQQLVAASQSSYATQSTSLGSFGSHSSNRYNKAHTSQLHNALANLPTVSSIAHHKSQRSNGGSHDDGGLAAYYVAWQQGLHTGDGDKEWKQYQFVKRIEWTPTTIVTEGKGKGKTQEVAESVAHAVGPRRIPLERAYSADAVQDFQRSDDTEVAAGPIVLDDGAVARDPLFADTEPFPVFEDALVAAVPGQSLESTELQEHQDDSPISSIRSDILSEATSLTSTGEFVAESFLKRISELHDRGNYAEIPATFEAMLLAGGRPTTAAYRALLGAAIELPASSHQVVPKALDVYADMLRRGVSLNADIYSTLINLLATRSLDVSQQKKALEERRVRFGGMEQAGRFMFRSNEADLDILHADVSLDMAVRLFDSALESRTSFVLSPRTYQLLLCACAERGVVSGMVRIYAALDRKQILPISAVFPAMIAAFASSSNLNGAVDCYNEYKALAIASDIDETSTVFDRRDEEVYAAVVKAYLVSGKGEGASKFVRKITETYSGLGESKVMAMTDTVARKAFIEYYVQLGSFAEGLKYIEEQTTLSDTARTEAIASLSVAAADQGDLTMATALFERLPASSISKVRAAMPLMALHIRQGNVEAATPLWDLLSSDSTQITSAFVEPTTMYSVALIGSGRVDHGLSQARQMFDLIRSSTSETQTRTEITEQIDEATEVIGQFLMAKGIVPSAQGSMNILWTMIENGGLVSSVADQVLAGIGPDVIAQFEYPDLILLAQIQAGMIHNKSIGPDAAAAARVDALLEVIMTRRMPVDARTQHLIDQIFCSPGDPNTAVNLSGLSQRWQSYLQPSVVDPIFTRAPLAPQIATVSSNDAYDPYSGATDYKGSTVIADELEKKGNKPHGVRLDDALSRFRNIRRVGRHPRYITYAKLIAAAARENRMHLAHDILAIARSDMPLLPQYRMVRYGWVSILDAMVGACLTMGERSMAAQFHGELLQMGSAPTANTFGLYITTLKESTKTFDEATEAVRIFHRARSEGVEPSSFLYNALIGKLGKARRIDDCLFYFAEMRGLGIRPTSVTYGTIVNALCRVSDERFAEELFEEMETMPNYRPRPAPYNSLIQFFLTTKRDRGKVLNYVDRMRSKDIPLTMHTYKLLIDSYATLEPIDLQAAEDVFDTMRKAGLKPEAVHFASLIHAKGCVLHDLAGARKVFDEVLADRSVRPQACLYQALFEAMVANHHVAGTEAVLQDMRDRRVEMTPYIANTLIHGWALGKEVGKARAVYDTVGATRREPSTYEAMARAYLAVDDREGALSVVQEMSSRRYPAAVASKILELVSGGPSPTITA